MPKRGSAGQIWFFALLVSALSLVLPASILAQEGSGEASQDGSARSEWQLLVRAVDWGEIEELEKRARKYRREGAIDHFEIRLSVNGPRYDALVVAAITDPEELARLRGLELPQLEHSRRDELRDATNLRGP